MGEHICITRGYRGGGNARDIGVFEREGPLVRGHLAKEQADDAKDDQDYPVKDIRGYEHPATFLVSPVGHMARRIETLHSGITVRARVCMYLNVWRFGRNKGGCKTVVGHLVCPSPTPGDGGYEGGELEKGRQKGASHIKPEEERRRGFSCQSLKYEYQGVQRYVCGSWSCVAGARANLVAGDLDCTWRRGLCLVIFVPSNTESPERMNYVSCELSRGSPCFFIHSIFQVFWWMRWEINIPLGIPEVSQLMLDKR